MASSSEKIYIQVKPYLKQPILDELYKRLDDSAFFIDHKHDLVLDQSYASLIFVDKFGFLQRILPIIFQYLSLTENEDYRVQNLSRDQNGLDQPQKKELRYRELSASDIKIACQSLIDGGETKKGFRPAARILIQLCNKLRDKKLSSTISPELCKIILTSSQWSHCQQKITKATHCNPPILISDTSPEIYEKIKLLVRTALEK